MWNVEKKYWYYKSFRINEHKCEIEKKKAYLHNLFVVCMQGVMPPFESSLQSHVFLRIETNSGVERCPPPKPDPLITIFCLASHFLRLFAALSVASRLAFSFLYLSIDSHADCLLPSLSYVEQPVGFRDLIKLC